MLLSETEEDWEIAFESAASLLIGHHHKLVLCKKYTTTQNIIVDMLPEALLVT